MREAAAVVVLLCLLPCTRGWTIKYYSDDNCGGLVSYAGGTNGQCTLTHDGSKLKQVNVTCSAASNDALWTLVSYTATSQCAGSGDTTTGNGTGCNINFRVYCGAQSRACLCVLTAAVQWPATPSPSALSR